MKKENRIAVIGLSGKSIFMKTDHFHHPGETIIASTYHQEYGGKGYNQAVAAKRFGVDVSFLTIVGNDEIADAVEMSLKNEGINTFVIKKANGLSAVAYILIDKSGKNQVTCYPGISTSLTKEDVKLFEKEIARSKYLLLQLEMSDESLAEAISIAKKWDTKIILNPAPYHQIRIDLLSKCDILTPNEAEANELFNLNNDFSINQIKKINFSKVVITLGEKGSVLKDEIMFDQINPLKVNAINTTGAGDTYNGVLAASLVQNYSLKEAAMIASIAASLSVTKEFVIDSIPQKSEIITKYFSICKKNNVKLEEDK